MNYWFDLTDIITRDKKHFTGIQRVVVNPMMELAKLHTNIKAFYFEDNAFKEVYFNPFKDSSFDIFRKSELEVNFQPSDSIVLLGATWGYKDLVRKLIHKKNELNFKIFSFIHDTTAISVPQYHMPSFPPIFENWMKDLIIPHSEKIITNSEYSKSDIIKLYKSYGHKEPDVCVVRLGDELDDIVNASPPTEKINNEFILCVSTIEPRKNHQLLFNTWHLFLDNFPSIDSIPTIYFVGGKGWNNDNLYFQITNHPILKEKMIHLQNISDNSLKWLYEKASFTIYPAKYEGWGLPVAESLAMGKYCIASEKTSIPEIGGELVRYINPHSSEDCFNAIDFALKNKLEVQKHEEKIKKEYIITPWSQTAKEIWNIIKN
ncbi:MAG: glycosyltransferase involved in cell wall biosynthesis [Bacteriovoracaceae bacterium]|jgi:glycosyltransferase involved in cell wall biosynthesis